MTWNWFSFYMRKIIIFPSLRIFDKKIFTPTERALYAFSFSYVIVQKKKEEEEERNKFRKTESAFF
jgi:hypothetical protein